MVRYSSVDSVDFQIRVALIRVVSVDVVDSVDVVERNI